MAVLCFRSVNEYCITSALSCLHYIVRTVVIAHHRSRRVSRSVNKLVVEVVVVVAEVVVVAAVVVSNSSTNSSSSSSK